ncbi:hypothetical protein EDC65_4069 [Stella humosa]|uniref:Uncharacterized protein n=1 Tax=Stella humosa TaxID=94 RepID=A0A3N1KVB2_9PROT|nr:hypothetical protein [Stella humosa]ROP83422.1 hypothetical protein EDC65_4069 [Stella humosa]BBK33306.1 hypothetical protein STHU_39400 [Stella humosa]
MKFRPIFAAILALATPAAASTLPIPRAGTTILWADGGTWTVTAADHAGMDVAATGPNGARDAIRIVDGVFPHRQDGQTTTYDAAQLAALRPLESGRVVNFLADETGPAGASRWLIHVAIAGRETIETPAGRFEVLLVENHRRSPEPYSTQRESLVEWSVAVALGLPVAMRAWSLVEGRAVMTLERKAVAIGLP